jgi:hypothetical protein
MAVEQRRACGFRKQGAMYLVSGGLGAPCCKLPLPLHICPTCNGGVKQTRGWQWIDPRPWLKGDCTEGRATYQWPADPSHVAFGCCPAATPDVLGERVGLLWIGAEFYPTPESFAREANTLGVSRRIVAIPRGFKLGESWVFLAHPRVKEVVDPETGDLTWIGGVFRIFKPERIEKIITDEQAKDEAEMKKLADAGITPVIVPKNDRDHQGTVYDRDSEDDPQQNLFTSDGGESRWSETTA